MRVTENAVDETYETDATGGGSGGNAGGNFRGNPRINTGRKKTLGALAICLILFIVFSGICLLEVTPKRGNVAEVLPVSENAPVPVRTAKYYKAVGIYPTVIKLGESITRGETAELELRGVPGKTYGISVYYASGKSSSPIFSPKEADYDGIFGWTWTVPANARTGEIRIVVYSDIGYCQFYVDIV